MKKEELIEQTAGLIAACKMDYYDIVKELTKLVSSIQSSDCKDKTPKVGNNEQRENKCRKNTCIYNDFINDKCLMPDKNKGCKIRLL